MSWIGRLENGAVAHPTQQDAGRFGGPLWATYGGRGKIDSVSEISGCLNFISLDRLKKNKKKIFNHFRGTGGDFSPAGNAHKQGVRHVVHQARGGSCKLCCHAGISLKANF